MASDEMERGRKEEEQQGGTKEEVPLGRPIRRHRQHTSAATLEQRTPPEQCTPPPKFRGSVPHRSSVLHQPIGAVYSTNRGSVPHWSSVLHQFSAFSAFTVVFGRDSVGLRDRGSFTMQGELWQALNSFIFSLSGGQEGCGQGGVFEFVP